MRIWSSNRTSGLSAWNQGDSRGVGNRYPCDDLVGQVGARRAVRSHRTGASAAALYLWLCQLRRAPYSYDWLDNFGRRSPRLPEPELTDVSPGDSFMSIFELVEANPGTQITLRMRSGMPTRIFGDVVLTYAIEEHGAERSLVVVIWFSPVGKILNRLRRDMLAWGDVIMMRKQLRTLCELATFSDPLPPLDDPANRSQMS